MRTWHRTCMSLSNDEGHRILQLRHVNRRKKPMMQQVYGQRAHYGPRFIEGHGHCHFQIYYRKVHEVKSDCHAHQSSLEKAVSNPSLGLPHILKSLPVSFSATLNDLCEALEHVGDMRGTIFSHSPPQLLRQNSKT